jgi:hypothetical protein
MLVDNKFIYLSLPRCASTSFMVSCVKSNIQINHVDKKLDDALSVVNKNMTAEGLAHYLHHNHEPCFDLINKFGREYDIISVKRNRYERFISTWEHIIHELEKRQEYNAANIFKKFNENDLMVYSSNDTHTENSINYIKDFLKNNNIELSNNENQMYLINMLYIQITPLYFLHNHNPNIIWFDFEKLNELEDWVSNKLKKPFKLEKSNSSKHIECNLKLTNNFIKKYNEIYDVYDFKKEVKTLI